MRNAQSTHAVHISLVAGNNGDDPTPQDDLAHLGDVRAVRRVNVASPVVSTPALTNEDSSRVSSSGTGPASIPENGLAHGHTGYYPRNYLTNNGHDVGFPAGNFSQLRGGPVYAADEMIGDPLADTRSMANSFNNRGLDDHATERSHMSWHPGFLPEVQYQDTVRSPNNDNMAPHWFQQPTAGPSFGSDEYENPSDDFRNNRAGSYNGQAFDAHLSPETRAGLVLPFDQLDAYGIFMGRHDIMTDSGFEEQMPLLPGTNIEQFLASLDRSMT